MWLVGPLKLICIFVEGTSCTYYILNYIPYLHKFFCAQLEPGRKLTTYGTKPAFPKAPMQGGNKPFNVGVSHDLASLVDVHIDTGWLDNLKLLDVLPLYRCIRPNELKSPDQFQTDKVLVQLRYTGVLETTRIRKEVWECVRRNVCVCVCVCVCVWSGILFTHRTVYLH